MKNTIAALIFTLAAPYSLIASAANTAIGSPTQTEYSGKIMDNGRPIPVQTNIDKSKSLGDIAGLVMFKGQWACEFKLEHAGADNTSTTIYSLKGKGHGRCIELESGYLRHKDSNTTASLSFSDKTNKTEKYIVHDIVKK